VAREEVCNLEAFTEAPSEGETAPLSATELADDTQERQVDTEDEIEAAGKRNQYSMDRFAVGARIQGRYRGGEEWFSGFVSDLHTSDGRCSGSWESLICYDLVYDDGETEGGVNAEHVRAESIAEAPAEVSAGSSFEVSAEASAAASAEESFKDEKEEEEEEEEERLRCKAKYLLLGCSSINCF
jgi:hypothetical protein